MDKPAQSKTAPLSEKQQLLLMSFFDGECGIISRWRASRLLARGGAAAEFMESLDTLSSDIEASVAADAPVLENSMWQSISNRIEQEERAALYLGNRSLEPVRARVRFSPVLAPMGWSVAGGVVAASFTFFFIGNMQSIDNEVNRTVSVARSSGRPSSVAPVSFASQGSPEGAGRTDELPRILERQTGSSANVLRRARQNPVDVDWVHSGGAVRFFSDPQQRSTMIWVKKRQPANNGASVRFFSPPTPLNASPRSSLREGSRLSEGNGSGYGDSPRILESKVPQSFSISNR